MSVAFTLYLMRKVLFYMRIVYDASGMNVCMYVYSGVCTPRVDSQQASQNKLIWFTLLCYCCEVETKYLFFIRKAFENCVWVTWPSARSLFVLLANFRCSLLLSWWLRIPVTNFFIFPSKLFWINQYTLCISAMAFYFPFLNILALNVFVFAFEKSIVLCSLYFVIQAAYSQQIRQMTQENQSQKLKASKHRCVGHKIRTAKRRTDI